MQINKLCVKNKMIYGIRLDSETLKELVLSNWENFKQETDQKYLSLIDVLEVEYVKPLSKVTQKSGSILEKIESNRLLNKLFQEIASIEELYFCHSYEDEHFYIGNVEFYIQDGEFRPIVETKLKKILGDYLDLNVEMEHWPDELWLWNNFEGDFIETDVKSLVRDANEEAILITTLTGLDVWVPRDLILSEFDEEQRDQLQIIDIDGEFVWKKKLIWVPDDLWEIIANYYFYDFVEYKEEKIELEDDLLDLSNMGIEDILEIKGLRADQIVLSLGELDLSNNKITEIKGLEELPKEIRLKLNGNNIPESVIGGLGGLDENGYAYDGKNFITFSKARLHFPERTDQEILDALVNINNFLTWFELRNVMKEAGADMAAKGAVDILLIHLGFEPINVKEKLHKKNLIKLGKQITGNAVKICSKAQRKRITMEDIKLAIPEFEKEVARRD